MLLHIALSWEDWLRNRLGEQDTPDAAPERFTSWEDLQEHRRRVRDWLRRIIHGTPEEKLVAQTEPTFVGMPGETLVSPADILEHILLLERGHPGDVTTQLSSLGAAPPSIDYLTYVYFQALSRAQHS